MKLETYKTLPINRSPIRLLKRDYLARMDFDLVGFPSGNDVKFKALLPDGQEYEDDDSSHFRILGSQLTYRVPRSLSESSGSLVSAFFVINNVESSRLLVHITEPNDTRSNDYVTQIDRIMNHVLSDAILINEISTNGSEIIDAKTDELIKQITDWTNTTLEKVNSTVSSSLTSIADVRAVIDKEIDADKNNFTSKMADVQSSIDKANDTMQSLMKTLDETKSEVNKIDVSQVQNDAKSAKDAANTIQTKLGNVPTGSTVMDEIDSKLGNYEKSADLSNLLKTYVLATQLSDLMTNYAKSDDVKSWIATSANQTKEYAAESIKAIIGAAPETLDTIAELADAVTENKDGVQAINEGITKKADKTEVTALQNTVQTMITSISQEDYDALVSAGTVDPKIMYVIPDA